MRARPFLVPLMRFENFSAAYASSANTCPLMSSINDHSDPLQIGVPSSLCDVMGMTDIISKQRTLSAKITACYHDSLSFYTLKKPQYSKESFTTSIG